MRGTVRPALTAGENINLPRSLKPADEPHHQIEEDHRGEHRKSDKEIDSRGAGPIDFSRPVIRGNVSCQKLVNHADWRIRAAPAGGHLEKSDD